MESAPSESRLGTVPGHSLYEVSAAVSAEDLPNDYPAPLIKALPRHTVATRLPLVSYFIPDPSILGEVILSLLWFQLHA